LDKRRHRPEHDHPPEEVVERLVLVALRERRVVLERGHPPLEQAGDAGVVADKGAGDNVLRVITGEEEEEEEGAGNVVRGRTHRGAGASKG
jgi:hypothetical protein